MLEDFVAGFLLHRESEGRSLKTIRWHRGNLRLFTSWIYESGMSDDPEQWDATLIRRYLVYLRSRQSSKGIPLSGYSIRSYATSVRAFCRWLHEEELTSKNAAHRVSLPQVPQFVKSPFTSDELKRLLIAASKDRRNGSRDYAILLFLLDTGCRAAEVIRLKVEEIIWDQRLARVYGKGSKERVVFFSVETLKAMNKYHLRRRNTSCEFFFQTEEGRPLTTSGLLHITKRLGGRANVLGVHPHRFRHTFAIEYLRSGGNVLTLQKIMGHTTLSVTQQYVAMVSDDLQKEHQLCSPVVRLMGR